MIEISHHHCPKLTLIIFISGETRTIERVSPSSIIILRPPDKLVLEVRAAGRYTLIVWRRNGVTFSVAPNTKFSLTFQELPNFFEIFVREPTTRDDLGVFTAELLTTTDFISFAVVGAGIESFHSISVLMCRYCFLQWMPVPLSMVELVW